MNFYCESERLVLQVLPAYYCRQVLDFYRENKEHIEPWEAEREKNFYTEGYQKALLEAEYQEITRTRMLRYYLFLKDKPDEIIGSVCASGIRYGAFDSCSIGYKMAKKYCGQGYGTEAVERLVEILFEEYHLHRIEAMVHPDNASSIALLEALQFEREGLSKDAAKLCGKWQDMYRYARIQQPQLSVE